MKSKSSTQKIVAGLLSFAMVLTLVVGFTVAPAQADTTMTTTTTTSSTSTGYVYTRNLTVGSRGDDVTALQTLLVSKGLLSVAPTGYFGSLTKGALAAWQASVGISPASGYFGPITRAYLAANMTTTTGTTSTVPGCAAGAMYSSTTGAPCTSTSTVPGCVAGAMFSSTTGASCGTTTTTGGTTGQGILTVTQSATPSSNANITTSTDVPVYGVQLMASGGSVNVDRLLLDVADTINSVPTVTENPGNFVNNVKVWDGSTILLNRNLTQADFIQGTSSTDYYIQLAGIGFQVPTGTTKNLVVSFSTSGSIDTSRTLTIRGYSGSSLLAYSGNNVQSYYDISGITLIQTFQKPGQSTLSIGTDASNPVASTNYVDPTIGAQKVTLLAFNALSTSGDSKIVEVDATTGGSITAPTALYLYDGSTLLASRSVSSSTVSTVTFTNLSDTITSGTTKVFTIKADLPSNTVNGSVSSTTVNTVFFQQSNGSTQTKSSLNIAGNAQTFFAAAPNLTFLSGTASSNGTNTSGQTAAITGTLVFKAHPQPGQELQPLASDFQVWVGTSLAAAKKVPAASTSISFSPSLSSLTAPLPANSDTTITLSATENGSDLGGSGAYYFYLTSASTTVNNTSGTPVQQTMSTTSLSNFYTPSPVGVTR